jgi:hypothetical protein
MRTAPRSRIALAAWLALAVAAPALAHENIARIETVPGGPYTIMIGLITDPPNVEAPLEVTIGAAEGTPTLAGATVTLTGLPGLGTDATPTRPVPLTLEEGETEYFEGKISLPVRGAWTLRLDVDGPAGKGTALLPVTVAAPAGVPLWLGWLIALSLLLGGAWFAWRNRRTRGRLRAEAARGL